METNHQNNFEERSEEVKTVLSRPPGWMLSWGNLIICFLTLSVFALSWIIKYPDVITVPASVVMENPPLEYISEYSGNIGRIYAEDGDQVEQSDTLYLVNFSANEQVLRFLEQIPRKFSKGRLLNPLEINTAFPPEVQALLGRLNLNLQNLQAFRNSDSMTVLLPKLRQEETTISNTLKSLKKEQELVGIKLNRAQNALKIGEQSHRQGTLSAEQLEELKIVSLEQELKMSQLEGAILEQNNMINDLERRYNLIRLSQKQKEDLLVSELKKRLAKVEQMIETIKNGAVVVRAPKAGVLVYGPELRKGRSVRGERAFSVESPKGQYQFSTRLSAVTPKFLKPGNEVRLSLENYPVDVFGTLKGDIAEVTYIQEENVCEVKLLVKGPVSSIKDHTVTAKGALTANLELMSEKRPLLDRLLASLKRKYNP